MSKLSMMAKVPAVISLIKKVVIDKSPVSKKEILAVFSPKEIADLSCVALAALSDAAHDMQAKQRERSGKGESTLLVTASISESRVIEVRGLEWEVGKRSEELWRASLTPDFINSALSKMMDEADGGTEIIQNLEEGRKE